ncbi:hypothetical protein Cs7R123_07510 [Catellatospora sp. TT07R-123]|uniref:M56 family metallopeptidase n=1 Tax=Catellatospora sp. TT07R-123 TaxID=2733863 RepID=UPI001B222B7D|nr:M56 family metallopeptidase [Catellatospora sp. TT07R-123]GHJ43409.1 hypothetical protein Cs7R123_07510 [Catellatospora sp. TT07R-123]
MRLWVYLPILVSALLPYAARYVARRTAPAAAARTITAAVVTTSAATVCCLALLALTLLDDLPPLGAFDHRPELGLPKPVPGMIALSAALLLAFGAVRLIREIRAQRRILRQLRAVGQPRAGLVVADMSEPFAVAVPGRPGHILVTTGMLQVLDAAERRVLFAHENAHLDRRHHRWVTAVTWSAAVNPLQRRVPPLVCHLVERWADEDAAAAVGDRHLVATAVAKASLASRRAATAPALGMSGSGAVERVTAMQHPRRTNRWQPLVILAVPAATLLVAASLAMVDFTRVAAAWLAMIL